MPSDKNAAGSHLGSSSSGSLALFIFSGPLQPFCFSCLSSYDENADTDIIEGRKKGRRGAKANNQIIRNEKWC